MDKLAAQKRIEELRSELNRHNEAYYKNNAPEISDQEFDRLMRELEDLEKENPEFFDSLSPTQRVGSDLSKGFEHVVHKRPMMSLANTYSIDEVDQWFGRVRKALEGEEFAIIGEMKFDGTSISLTYKDGRLVRAVTRGDGTQGDDVTANVKTIRSIPLVLQPGDWPDEFEIRGEILLPWKEFDRLNREREYNEEPLFANPRNAASGTLKTLDPKIVASRGLDARFYYLISDHLPYDNHYDNMEAARRWGFKVSKAMKLLHSSEEVNEYINYWDEHRSELPVATDGLVFKINSLRQQLNLGYTAKSPRWAIAYKFNPENACTKLRFVTFETGRMGIVTPVANLEPVLLSGTIVKRASLHNSDIMSKLDIHQGDWLYVEKGGEIIPKITGVDVERRDKHALPVEFVGQCPECGTPLVKIEGEAAYRCPNKFGCRPQITGRLEHFAARRMMNIDGIGEETACLLFDCGLVKSPADLYDLTVEKLDGLDGIGEKTARRIIDGIAASKSVPFTRVVYALSIPNVGETTARRLAMSVGDIERLKTISKEELTATPDIGPVIAAGIVEWRETPEFAADLERLIAAGLTMSMPHSEEESGAKPLEGKTIVISGTFAHHSRDEYKEMIERLGGKNAGSISKKTSFVLAGENMGPAKRVKCDDLGIPLVSEDEFLKMISTDA